MRSFLIVIAFAAVCGCGVKRPYFDLRQPFYFETDKSFWLGCEGDSDSAKATRQYRVDQIYAGLSEWFNYFDKANQPQGVVVFSDKELPPHLVNRVIHLGISETFCGKDAYGKKDAGACYNWPGIFSFAHVSIVFKNINMIEPDKVAHEFGHALGRDDNDVPAAYGSVMSYTLPTPVTPLDMKMVCKMHHECRMVKRKHRKN